MRILTDEELIAIDPSIPLLTVSLDFGAELSTTEIISHSDYAKFLKIQHEKFKETAIGAFLESLYKGFEHQAEKNSDYLGTPETTFKVSICGGCGCNPGTSGLGYVEGHICWCC